MENVTKALLIAASVLVAIVIIAFGVLLLRSSGNSTQQADKVGTEISNSSNHVVKELQGYKYVETEKYMSNFGSETLVDNLNNSNVRENIWIKGYIYNKYDTITSTGWGVDQNTCLKQIAGETIEQRNKRIIEQVSKSKDFIAVKNVKNKDEFIKEVDSYLKAHATVPDGAKRGPYTSALFFYNYDKERIYR